ncbi:putative F-box only protein 9 [Brassica napus]|nr:putative F-box only protein 9 [Brassica napus]
MMSEQNWVPMMSEQNWVPMMSEQNWVPMMSDFPPDLVEEILSRVPATSLKRLRSSCKRWNSLFKDHRFAEKHFHKAPRESHLIMLNEFMFCPMNVNLNVFPPSVEFKDEVSLKDFHSNESEEVYISDCFYCDGLLLCTDTYDRLVVWNPCLGETRWIQCEHGYVRYSVFALGYANTTSGRSYKIIMCYRTVVKIYEFGSGSWKVLDDVTLDQVPNGCVSIKGNTYWTNSYIKDDFLFCFDFTKERELNA